MFALSAVVGDTSSGGTRERIDVTEADVVRLTQQFEATVRRPPSESELSGLIDGYVREEVLVREARALSLDRDDAIVRQHLAQKMQFLFESDAEAAVATDAELRAYFEKNAEKFAVAPVVAFEQLQLDPDGEKAEAVLAALRSGSDPGAFGRESPLPRDIPPIAKQVVDGTFGSGFFDRLARVEVGHWSGPIASAYGAHLVRVHLIAPGRQPPFDEIREQVEQEWRRAKAQELYAALLSRYEVKRPGAARAPAE